MTDQHRYVDLTITEASVAGKMAYSIDLDGINLAFCWTESNALRVAAAIRIAVKVGNAIIDAAGIDEEEDFDKSVH